MAARQLARRLAIQRPLFNTSRPATLALRMSSKPQTDSTARRRLHATSAQLQQATTTAATTPDSYPTTHDKVSQPIDTENYIDNKFSPSSTSQWLDLYDPSTNNLVTRVPQSTDAEMRAAVESSQKAFESWRHTTLLSRQQLMFKFVALIRENWDRLAASITLEQGKTFADAKGDVLRGLQVAETACAITTQLTGEVLEVAKDMETRTYKEPIGVTAAICPFSMSRCSTSGFWNCRVTLEANAKLQTFLQ